MRYWIRKKSNDDSSSLLPIGKKQSELFPHTGEKETRTTPVLPLNEAINIADITKNSLLKIDVQGFELEVLKGCLLVLDKFKYVYVECSFIELYETQALANDVSGFLIQQGFIFSGIYNVCYDDKGLAIQADFLFCNSIQ